MTTDSRKIFEELPFEIEDVDNEVYEKMEIPNLPQFKGVLVGPKKYYFHPSYKTCCLDYYNFKSRPDDVWILGIMRSGTTLTSELAYLLVNNLNYKDAADTDLLKRVPNLEFHLLAETLIDPRAAHGSDVEKVDMSQLTKKLDAVQYRRCIRSHIPISLLSPHIFDVGAKVIYCARNPKDVIISSFHFFQLFYEQDFNSFEKYFRMFKSNTILFLPYFEHLKEGWAKRNDPNFLFIFYEETLKDKRKAIKQISEFLEIDITEEEIRELEDHSAIEKFKKNKSLNMDYLKNKGLLRENGAFIRNGQPGEWKHYFKGDLEKEVDDWIQENLKGTDIKFPVIS